MYFFTLDIIIFIIRETLFKRGLHSLFHIVLHITCMINWDSRSPVSHLLKGRDFSLCVFVAPSLPFQFVLKDTCKLGWIPVSHKGSCVHFQFFQEAGDNERIAYTYSNPWVPRVNHVTSNGGNSPRLLWSSNDLEPRVSRKTLHLAVGNDLGL